MAIKLSPGGIWIDDPEGQAKIDTEDKKLMDLYNSNPKIKELADKYHSSGMMAPPVCHACIAAAERKLNEIKTN